MAAATAIQEIHDHLPAEMGHAQAIQAEEGNRRHTPVPVFRHGDKVWLDAWNIKTHRQCRKLDHHRLGPYEVVKSIGTSTARLHLPATVQIHPVFHISLLEHATNDPYPGQTAPPPPDVIVDGVEEWEVETIFVSRLHYNRL